MQLSLRDRFAVQAVLFASICAIPAMSVSTAFAEASSAEIASGFEGDGIVITESEEPPRNAVSALQPDGKIVVAASHESAPVTTLRYLPDGRIDSTFGEDGRARVEEWQFAWVSSLVVQPDGKIVLAGSTVGRGQPEERRIVVARLNSDGTPDLAFGVGGIQYSCLGICSAVSRSSAAFDLVVQPDGKIVVGAVAARVVENGGDRESEASVSLVRLDGDGDLDLSFGSDGISHTYTSMSRCLTCSLSHRPGLRVRGGIELQADGRIVLVGDPRSSLEILVARHLSDGTLDPAFGGDGTVLWSLPYWSLSAANGLDVAVQPDGRILMLGTEIDFDPGWDHPIVVRYEPDGTVDETFNAPRPHVVEEHLRPAEIAVQPDGKVVVSGQASAGTEPCWADLYLCEWDRFGVLRFLSTGDRDTTFGRNGAVTTRVTPDWEQPSSGEWSRFDDNYDVGQTVMLQADGKIVVAGVSQGWSMGEERWAYSLVRYRPNGELDGAQPGALGPLRLLDSRAVGVTVDGESEGVGVRVAGSVTELRVAGRGGVPDDAESVLLNVAAVGPESAGYVTVFACGESRPLASNINYRAGVTIANSVLARVGADGAVCLFTSADVELVVDVTGFISLR